MEARDLMIGDWVYNKHHKKNIKITPFDFFTHGHFLSSRQYFIGEPELVSGRNLEPIPLTPEILEKNGFVLTDDGWTYFEDNKEKWHNYVFIKFRHNGEPRVVGINTVNAADCLFRNVRYIHELQHALRLCGINKHKLNLL